MVFSPGTVWGDCVTPPAFRLALGSGGGVGMGMVGVGEKLSLPLLGVDWDSAPASSLGGICEVPGTLSGLYT